MPQISGQWFLDLLLDTRKANALTSEITPEETIAKFAKKAFQISAGAALIPGPFGLATLLPELFAVTRLQIDLVQAIAKHCGQTEAFNTHTLLYVFGKQGGHPPTHATRLGMRHILIKTFEREQLNPLALRIGATIASRIAAKAAGRIVPIVFAPLFGVFTQKMTEEIGWHALELFSGRIEWQTCSEGGPNVEVTPPHAAPSAGLPYGRSRPTP